MKKLYKKTLKSFGGGALYLDKCILEHLHIQPGDEVIIELEEGKVTVTKPLNDAKKIKEILDANGQFKKGN